MQSFQWIAQNPWIIEIGITVLLLFFLNVILKRAITGLQRKAKQKPNDWRGHLDYAALTPARVLLWILLISVLLDLLVREFHIGGALSYLTVVRDAGIVFCIAWFLLRWKRVLHNVISSYPNNDPFTLDVAGKLFTIAVLFLTLLIVMQIFGFNIVPLLTFGGIGAATLGFAAKDAIANFFGGLMIYLTRPFMVGDLIELPQRKILGHVENIGWYITSLRDPQKRPIYIPNSLFSTEPLTNQSRITHRRIEESLGIRYSDIGKLPKIIEEINSLFEHHTSIDHHEPIFVFLQNFGDSAVNIEIKVYVLHTRYEDFMETRQEILLQIHRIVEELGAEMPYQTMQVIVQQQ